MPKSTQRKRGEKRRRKPQRARRKNTAYGLLATGALLLVLAFFTNRLNNLEVEPLTDTQTLALGAEVYTANCALCHGPVGNGHGPGNALAPALNEREHAWHHPDGQLQQLVSEGGVEMPGFGETLSNQEIIAVIRYFQTWWEPGQLSSQQSISRQEPMQP